MGNLQDTVQQLGLDAQWTVVAEALDELWGISMSLTASFTKECGFQTDHFEVKLHNLEQEWSDFSGPHEPTPCVACGMSLWDLDPIDERVHLSMRTPCCGKVIYRLCLRERMWDKSYPKALCLFGSHCPYKVPLGYSPQPPPCPQKVDGNKPIINGCYKRG